MNFFPHHIGPLLFQNRIDPCGQFARYRHNGFPCRSVPWVSLVNRAVKLSKLSILADGRPSTLNELAAQPAVSAVGDRSPRRPISRGVLGRSL